LPNDKENKFEKPFQFNKYQYHTFINKIKLIFIDKLFERKEKNLCFFVSFSLDRNVFKV